MTVAYAISRADLVIIPLQGSQLDAREAAKAIHLVRRQEDAFRVKIPFALLYTRTSSVIRPRSLRAIQEEFLKHGMRCLGTQIQERDAYKALFSFGGTLEALKPGDVPNRDAAIQNAREFAAEVIALVRELRETHTAMVA